MARLEGKYVVALDGCWEWTAATVNTGYGTVYHDGAMRLAHRVSYERHIGPIPNGLVLDHLCRNVRCVNPAHLEPVTNLENLRRQWASTPEPTHCRAGHEYSEVGFYTRPGDRGNRRPVCKVCHKARIARYKGRRAV